MYRAIFAPRVKNSSTFSVQIRGWTQRFGRVAAMAVGGLGAAVSASPAADVPPELAGPWPWSLHTQATYIEQFHEGFRSAYEGPNSFTPRFEAEHTFSFTLYLDRKLWPGAELIYNPEMFQGQA